MEKKIVKVELNVMVLCDVEVSMDEFGEQAEIHSINIAMDGNVLPPVLTDLGSLTDDEYIAIDEAAAKAFS